LLFETSIGILLLYVPPLNSALGTRPIPSPHFVIPALVQFCLLFFYDEVRKIYVRLGILQEGNKLRYVGWVARNTYY
jgi:hypothetical protein